LYPDGLSIPTFSFGRKVHTRTVSLSLTLTNRSRGDAPDWVLWARRSAALPKEPEISKVVPDVDVEKLAAETVEIKGVDDDAVPGNAIEEVVTQVPGKVVLKSALDSSARDSKANDQVCCVNKIVAFIQIYSAGCA
jgi:hypothetical protein